MPVGADVAKVIAQAISIALQEINAAVTHDDNGREAFTKGFVDAVQKNYPEYNWIVVCTDHTVAFDGQEGDDWGHGVGTFDRNLGGDVSYDIYYCRSGTFALHGDGGYINWAWHGTVASQSSDGRLIMFARPA